MNGEAAYQQKEDALLRTFYMFIAMALLVVQAGLYTRGVSRRQTWLRRFHPLTPLLAHPPASPDLFPTAFQLIAAARAILRRLDAMTRETYEFIKQAWTIARSTSDSAPLRERALNIVHLDTS